MSEIIYPLLSSNPKQDISLRILWMLQLTFIFTNIPLFIILVKQHITQYDVCVSEWFLPFLCFHIISINESHFTHTFFFYPQSMTSPFSFYLYLVKQRSCSYFGFLCTFVDPLYLFLNSRMQISSWVTCGISSISFQEKKSESSPLLCTLKHHYIISSLQYIFRSY